MRSSGGGELSLSARPGVGNRPPSEKKLQIPGGMPGGMVTGRIEPCIKYTFVDVYFFLFSNFLVKTSAFLVYLG